MVQGWVVWPVRKGQLGLTMNGHRLSQVDIGAGRRRVKPARSCRYHLDNPSTEIYQGCQSESETTYR